MTYADFLEDLNARGAFRIKPQLNRIRRVMRVLGNPQEAIPTIHIAGTNGKGSVAASLESVLRASGYRTGLYTSPHLVDLRERIKINGDPLVHGFLDSARAVLQAERSLKISLTYFELMTAIAFHAFQAKRVEIVILECGLGGLWDATNIIKNPLMSIVTSIGLDHTEWLGMDEYAIAHQKAGIIKPHGYVVSGVSEPGRHVITRIAREKKARLVQLGTDFQATALSQSWRRGKQGIRFTFMQKPCEIISFGLLGAHQARNAALVMAGIHRLQDLGWIIPKSKRDQGLREIHWPGRLQMMSKSKSATLVLDGAHNPPAMKALLESIEDSSFKNSAKTFVFSCFKDKDIKQMGRMMARLAAEVCLCPLDSERAASLEQLKSAFNEVRGPVRSFRSPREALEGALKDTPQDGIVVVCGSLLLVGEILKMGWRGPLIKEKARV